MFKLYFLNQDLKDVISVSRAPPKNPLPTYSILERNCIKYSRKENNCWTDSKHLHINARPIHSLWCFNKQFLLPRWYELLLYYHRSNHKRITLRSPVGLRPSTPLPTPVHPHVIHYLRLSIHIGWNTTHTPKKLIKPSFFFSFITIHVKPTPANTVRFIVNVYHLQ